jgi:hypothetical protein
VSVLAEEWDESVFEARLVIASIREDLKRRLLEHPPEPPKPPKVPERQKGRGTSLLDEEARMGLRVSESRLEIEGVPIERLVAAHGSRHARYLAVRFGVNRVVVEASGERK